MTRECRIGSLSWFAGLWWLGLGGIVHEAAWGVFWVRDGLTLACYQLCALAGRCFARASSCAKEGME